MLPGQGSQFPGMGQRIFDGDRTFRSSVEEFFHAYGDDAAELDRLWREGTRKDLARGEIAQPLLFALTFATSRALLAAVPGLDPVLIGHSVGELAAATVAGVFPLELAAAVIRRRAELLREGPAGGMVGVRGEPEEVLRQLSQHRVEGVIGADNGPSQCVVSLAEAEVGRAVAVLRGAGMPCMRVPSTQPFHSPLLAGLARQLGDFLAARAGQLRPPQCALVSSFAPGPVEAIQALDPHFWTVQMAEPVRFREALHALDAPGALYVEAGPGTTLSVAAAGLPHVAAGSSRVVATQAGPSSDLESWVAAVGQIRSFVSNRR